MGERLCHRYMRGCEQLAVTSLLPQGWNLYLPSHLTGPEFSYYYEGGMSGDQRAPCESQIFSSTTWVPGANWTWPQRLLLLNHLTSPCWCFLYPPHQCIYFLKARIKARVAQQIKVFASKTAMSLIPGAHMVKERTDS